MDGNAKNNTCGEISHTRKEREKHIAYHHRHQKKKTTNTITSQGIIKLDRRKPLQEGTPRENKFIYNNNIRFNTTQNRWTCQKCNKTYGPNSMRNAIQHARHHITTGNTTQKKKMARMDRRRKNHQRPQTTNPPETQPME